MEKSEYLNLCDDCKFHPATCESDPKFGTGKGNDNVYECSTYKKEAVGNTMTQLHCQGCKEVTWHRRKLHDHVCNTCDTSRRIEGSNRTIML